MIDTVWIIKHHKPLTTLWGTIAEPYFTLVDENYQGIPCSSGIPYELATMALAEAKVREVLTPYLNEITHEFLSHPEN